MTLRFWARQPFGRPAARPTHKAPAWFGPLTIGFGLGGGLLGTAGCILGVYMPYHHPVAVVISALWWGIYLGCLGASVGALIVRLTERAQAACSVPQEERVDCYDHNPNKGAMPRK
jgi:hypothetical protein